MTLLKNDKVILTKEYDNMRSVGSTYEVANVTETVVVLRNPKSKVAVGAIDIDDFENHFAKELKGWTNWTVINGSDGSMVGYYKTNMKIVKVKTVDGYRSKSTCCKGDEFNLYRGVNLALLRCNKKKLVEIADSANSAIVMLTEQIKSLSE